jgi:Zn-dependent protease with chaperone function
MPTDLLLTNVAAAAGTYLLHSTLWCGLVAMSVAVMRPQSHALRSWLWLAALLLPVLTTAGSVLRAGGDSRLEWRIETSAESVKTPSHTTEDATALPARLIASEVDRATAQEFNAEDAKNAVTDAPPVELAMDGMPDAAVTPWTPPLVIATNAATEGEPWRIQITPAAEPAADSVVDAAVVSLSLPPVNIAAPPNPPVAARSIEVPSNPQSDWPRLAGWFVLSAGICGLALFLVRILTTRRWLRRGTAMHAGPARELLDRLYRQWGVARTVALLSHPQCSEPAACGMRRATIVLPEGLEQRLPREELTALLAHELAHHARRDPLWLGLGQLVTHLAWWQPLNGLAIRQWRRSAESLCDQWTLGRGVSALTLAKCLANIAEWRLSGTITPGLTAGGASLSLRIEQLLSAGRITDAWQSPGRRWWLTLSMLGAVASLAALGPRIEWNVLPAAAVEAPAVVMVSDTAASAPADVDPSAAVLLESTNSKSTVSAASADLTIVAADLDRALRLLAAMESAPEVDALVAKLQLRLRRIEASLPAAPRDPDATPTTANTQADSPPD